MVITANELKTKGVSIIEKVLKKDSEALISVRGKRKFIIMPVERYDELREMELHEALRQAKEDYRNGNVNKMDIDEHMKELGYAETDYK
ncbi:MAG TPA: prevent-host-death protein [Lentisphaeria bacterium]|nr:MAG: prevent-host-death protein [Lentisphaerae bacterium GWF2_38_69]HBM15820.1 prevent-host-death protein [Lentisphaeria bacterium]